MLVEDGSIEVIETVEQQKKLESDPTAGAMADGRKEKAPEKELKPEAAGKPDQRTKVAREETKPSGDKARKA